MNPPGDGIGLAPGGMPLLGHAGAFLRDKLGFLDGCRDRYGNAVQLKIGDPVWLLNDPEDIQQILATNGRNYEKGDKLTSDRGRRLSGHGLLTATGDTHLPRRRQLQPMYRNSVVDPLARLVVSLTDQLTDTWRDGAVIDGLGAMMGLSRRIMIQALFGDGFRDAGGRFARATAIRRRYIEYFFTSNLPWPEYLPTPQVFAYRRARKYIFEVIRQQMAARREGRTAPGGWLTMLMEIEDRDGNRLDDPSVLDEAVTITSTGYETIAAGLAWTLHLIARHPGVFEAVREEVAALPETETQKAGALEALPFTLQVISESWRLFPPTWIWVRVANGPDLLPSGARIAAGDKIYICPWTLHRHPGIYPEPGRFDPARWEPEAVRQRPRFSYIPFGGGTRQCIGEPLARLETGLVIARLVRNFRFTPAGRKPIRTRPSIVLEPRGGLPLRVAFQPAAA